jgi:hypothetical protein
MSDPVAEMTFDDRYRLFLARTEQAFAEFPQMELMRPLLFKGLVVGRAGAGRLVDLKRVLRPWLKRDQTSYPSVRSDALVWLELPRETLPGELLPVRDELARRGVSISTFWYQGPTNLPANIGRFGVKPRGSVPKWTRNAWEALVDAEPELADSSPMYRAFRDLASSAEGVLGEMERLFDAIQPRAVVCAATNVPGGSAMAVVARRRGINSLMLQHGYWQPMHLPVITDAVGCWGPVFRDWLVEHDVPDEQVITLGSPRHDTMARAGGARRSEFLRALNLPDRLTFVFFSCGNELSRNQELPLRCADWLSLAGKRFGDQVNLVIRLHPNEDGVLYQGSSGLHVYKGQPDLDTTLDACDWSGSLCSTTMYEALLYRKPIWQFLDDQWPDLSGIAARGLAERVSGPEDLVNRIATFLDRPPTPSHDAAITARAFANHGYAADAVADCVEESLRKSKTCPSGLDHTLIR